MTEDDGKKYVMFARDMPRWFAEKCDKWRHFMLTAVQANFTAMKISMRCNCSICTQAVEAGAASALLQMYVELLFASCEVEPEELRRAMHAHVNAHVDVQIVKRTESAKPQNAPTTEIPQ